MAQLYQLVPLPQGIFAGMDLVTRAVVGLLYDRIRLSNYNLIGDPAGSQWYDPVEKQVNADNLVWWRKATYKGANRYFLHYGIMDALKSSPIRSNCPDNPAKMAGL